MNPSSVDWASAIQLNLDDLGEFFSSGADITPRLIPGERRAVAVLFLDLEGFTAMSEQLDHEALHRITTGVMGRLSRLVEFHGGYVDKFEGDRIMALFGAHKAHENDCIRAVSCAMRMIDAVQEFSAILSRSGFAMNSRSGVNYGDVTVAPDPSGHVTATGDIVNTASRMEETAEAGTVQVTEAVRETAGDHFGWKDLGPVTIRGKREKLRTFRPTGPGIRQRERWERARELSSVPFVGRSRELEELRKILRMQTDGGAGFNRRGGAKHLFAGIRGSAGIGKSRLVHEFRRKVETDSGNALVLKAGCVSYAQPPLLLMLSLIRNWIAPECRDGISQKEMKSRLQEKLKELSTEGSWIREDSLNIISQLLSAENSGISGFLDMSADEARLRVLSSLSELFRVMSAGTGRLVIILDDVHWIDSASRECLEFIATSCDTAIPILFVLIYRPQPPAGLSLLVNLPEEYTVTMEIPVAEMDPESLHVLVRHLLGIHNGSAGSRQVTDFLLKASGGNAFFLEELVLGLTENGLLRRSKEGDWELAARPESIVIPQSIKGLIRARTDQLPTDPRRLLQVASVIGEEFSREVLFQVASNTGVGTDPDASLEDLLARGFLNPDSDNEDLLRFDHVLARDAVYETILKHNRRYLHSLCANVLSRRAEHDPGLAGSVTRHYADAGDIENAIPWGIRAQDHAVACYDGDAVLLWSEKLEEWIRRDLESEVDARLLAGILNKRQMVEGYRLQTENQRRTLERISDLIDRWGLDDLRAGYLMSMGSMHRLLADYPRALEMFREALGIYEESNDKKGIARASSSIAMCNRSLGRLEESEKDQRYAISLFRELGDTENIARSLFRLASTMLPMGRYEQGLQILDEAIVHARETGARAIEANVLSLRGILHLQIGRFQEALENQELALAIYREVGDKSDEISSLNSISNALYRLGRHEEAREYGLQTLQASREFGSRRTEANVLCTLGLIELASGRDGDALDYFHDSLQAQRDIGGKFAQAAVHWNLGLTYYNLLDFPRGLEHARESIRLYREVGNRIRTASKLVLHPITLIEAGKIEEAEECLREFHRDFSDMNDFKIEIQLNYTMGCLALSKGDTERAEMHFRKALKAASENDSNECVAQSLQNIGLIRLGQGNTDEALDYLGRGFESLDGTEYFRTFLPEAEYHLMKGDKEKSKHFALKARDRAQAIGNSDNLKRSLEILKELGAV